LGAARSKEAAPAILTTPSAAVALTCGLAATGAVALLRASLAGTDFSKVDLVAGALLTAVLTDVVLVSVDFKLFVDLGAPVGLTVAGDLVEDLETMLLAVTLGLADLGFTNVGARLAMGPNSSTRGIDGGNEKT